MTEIKRGSHITVKHKPSGQTLYYRVIATKVVDNDILTLVNLRSYYVMSTCKAKDQNGVIKYLEDNLHCEIVEIFND